MKRSLKLSLGLACAALLVGVMPTSAAVPKLVGTVGPGFTITLKKNGVRVTKLKAGRYTFTIRDRADVHNFALIGPGLTRDLTSVAFVGTKTVTLRLRPGRYTYLCDPHAADMSGTFRVVR
jgi:plastocyanin